MTVLSRRAFAALAFCTVMVMGATGLRADDAADANSAQDFIRKLADKALVLVNDKVMNDKERAERFRTLFMASFDIPEVGKFVLGRHWKNATPDQQQEFLKDFTDFTVLTWSTRFKDYSGVSFQLIGASSANDGYYIVDSRIKRSQGDPLNLGWRVHKVDGDWRITDVIVEGVSMVLTQRQDFAGALQSTGGKIENLLATMRKKNAELSAGK